MGWVALVFMSVVAIVYAPIVAFRMWLRFCEKAGALADLSDEARQNLLKAASSFPVAAWIGMIKAAAPLIRQAAQIHQPTSTTIDAAPVDAIPAEPQPPPRQA